MLLSLTALAGLIPGEEFKHAKALEDAGRSAEARVAFEAIIQSKAAEPHDQAASLMELSRMDLGAGKYVDSVSEGHTAAQGLHSTGDLAGEGLALTIAGLANTYSGSYDAALADLRPALQIARSSGDRKQEITRLNNIAITFYYQGRYADALEELQNAMRLVDLSRDEEWNASRRQLTVANTAIVYQSLGQYDRALETYAGLRSASDRLELQERAQLLANMGALYRRLGDPVKALEAYSEARALYQQRQLVLGQIKLLNNMGIALAHDLRRYREALASFGEAVRMAKGSGDKLGIIQSRLYRGQTFFLMGRLREAEADFASSAAAAKTLHASEERWKALYGLARIAYEEGDSVHAAALLVESVSLIESLRGQGPNALLAGFLADKREVYDLLIRELAGVPQPDAAALFRLMELSRARALQDRRQTPNANPSLGQIQAKLAPDTMMLEYWVGTDSVVVLWANWRKAGIVFKQGPPDFRVRLRDFASTLSDPNETRWREPAVSIARDLVEPVRKQLADPSVQLIVIVPDREISLVPFEVLPLPESPVKRLVDRYAMSYLPSASLVQRPEGKRSSFPFWRRTLLALGDPAPRASSGEFSMPSGRDARRLPAAAAEVRSLGAIIGGRTSVYTGAKATKDNLKRGLRTGFPFVHLATHAIADAEDPARSYILLAGAKGNQAYDYLFLREIRDLEWKNVDLVTLSACETERGKLVEGEGVSGFGRALLESGARTVISSLWRVNDRASATLMEAFYREMEAGTPAAESLRRAKVQLGNGDTAHPFYWSAFVLNGQPDTTLPFVIGGIYPLAAGLGFFGAGLLVWHFMRGIRKSG